MEGGGGGEEEGGCGEDFGEDLGGHFWGGWGEDGKGGVVVVCSCGVGSVR